MIKLSDEMKDRIRKIHGMLNSEEILESYSVECMFLQEKKDLEQYLPKIEALEKENERLKAENKKWNKEFDKYDF